jgi:hypothetical protein
MAGANDEGGLAAGGALFEILQFLQDDGGAWVVGALDGQSFELPEKLKAPGWR